MARNLNRLGLLAACVLSGPALAQSVTLYGRVDVGVQHVDNGVLSKNTVDSGHYTASRFGFRGKEDLGSGLSAIFQFENGFDASTGKAQSEAKLFNRGAHVGLSSSTAGTLTLGRQYVPIFWTFLYADDAGRVRLHGASTVQSVQRSNFARIATSASPLQNGGSLAPSKDGLQSVGITSAYEDNLLVYKSPNWAGASASLAYGVGNESGASSSVVKRDGRVFGGNLEYNRDGLFVGAAFNRKDGYFSNTSGEHGQHLNEQLVSAMVTAAPNLKIWGNYHPWSLSAADQRLKGHDWMLGVSYTLPSGMLWANYADKTIKNCASCNSSGFGIGYHHHLSKRTELYTSIGKVSNQGNSANSLNGTAPGAFGKSVTAVAVGVAHQF